MNRWISPALLAGVVVLVCACTNLFTTFSNTVSDESLLDQAKIYINEKNFTAAIALFPMMSTTYQTRADIVSLWAGAYAGRAGLDFLTLVNNLKSIGSTNLLLFLMQNFDHGSASNQSDLKTATSLMVSIGAISSMSNDELVELTLISFATMGNVISRYGDTNADGTVDAGFDPCTTVPGTDPPPPDDAQQFGYALNLAVQAISQLSTNGVSLGPSGVTGTVSSACGSLPAADDFCSVSGEGFNSTEIKGILSIIKSDDIGLSICGTGAAGSISGGCVCP